MTIKNLYNIKFKLTGDDKVTNSEMYQLQLRLIRLGINWYASSENLRANRPKYTHKRSFIIDANGFMKVSFSLREYNSNPAKEVTLEELSALLFACENNSFGSDYFLGKKPMMNEPMLNYEKISKESSPDVQRVLESLSKLNTVTVNYISLNDAITALSALTGTKVKIVSNESEYLR